MIGAEANVAVPAPPEPKSKARSAADHSLVNEICSFLGYEPDRVRGPSRYREDADARGTVAIILREDHGWSYPRIGYALGGRHHSTVMFICGGTNKARKRTDIGASIALRDLDEKRPR